MALLPPIGTAGIYDLNSPFASKLQPNISYRCESIRRFSDMLQLGEDPYELHYSPNGLSLEIYNNDALNSTCIVSLQSASGHWVHVPSTYIRSFPNVNGVPYRAMVLGVEIGPVPEHQKLETLKAAISDIVRDNFGVTPSIKEVAISSTQNFSQRDHEILEQQRAAQIVNSPTYKSKYLALQKQFEALQRDYDLLAQQHMTP